MNEVRLIKLICVFENIFFSFFFFFWQEVFENIFKMCIIKVGEDYYYYYYIILTIFQSLISVFSSLNVGLKQFYRGGGGHHGFGEWISSGRWRWVRLCCGQMQEYNSWDILKVFPTFTSFLDQVYCGLINSISIHTQWLSSIGIGSCRNPIYIGINNSVTIHNFVHKL